VQLHIEDMVAVGTSPRRSKAANVRMLQRDLGTVRISTVDRERLIQYGRARSEAGAGPVTLGIDIGTIGLVLSHAAAVHGLPVSTEQVALARIALKRLGLIGKDIERDRRPTESEIDALESGPINLLERWVAARFKPLNWGGIMIELCWLTDAQIERLRPFFPKSLGKPGVDALRLLSGLIFIERNGLVWQHAPAAHGPAKTLHDLWKR
jgi:hypothetical protein